MSSARKRASRQKAFDAAARHIREVATLRAQVSMWKQAAEFLDAQLKAVTTWQPIETAPRETEIFIGAFIDGEFQFGRSERFFVEGNEFEGEFYKCWIWSIDDCSESVAEAPTHWMPLPKPPEGR